MYYIMLTYYSNNTSFIMLIVILDLIRIYKISFIMLIFILDLVRIYRKLVIFIQKNI